MDRYQNIQERKTLTGQRYYKTVKYPEIPLAETDIYVLTTQGDRLDVLAAEYLSDETLYWVISVANPNLNKNSLFVAPGLQIRIPTSIQQILIDYKNINQL